MKKKTFKKAGAAVLTMAMVLSMGALAATSVGAVSTGTITVNAVNGLVNTDAVKIYKVATKTATGWTWTADAYATAAGKAIENGANFATLQNIESEDNKKNLATALASVAKTKAADFTTTVGTAKAVEEGYYVILVTPDNNSTIVQPILEQIDSNEAFVINAKSEQISLTKTITAVKKGNENDGEIENGGKNAMAKAGDTITYRIVAPIPSYDIGAADSGKLKPFVLTDTFQTTLTYQSVDAFVGDTADATEATAGAKAVTVAHTDGQSTFTASLTGENLLASGGKYLIVTFNAVLSGDPVLSKGLGVRTATETATAQEDIEHSADANKNDVTLTFGNDYITGGWFDKDGDGREDPEEKPELKDYADIYTSALFVNKTLNGTSAAADDVGFTLYADAEKTEVVAAEQFTDANGKVSFKGLDAGTYILSETTPKAGYKVVNDVTVSIEKDGSVSKFKVNNPSGFTVVSTGGFEMTIDNPALETLPGTGGIGTIIFTVGGAAIVLLAGAMFVFYMKKRKVED